jgi:sarcosine oxidase
VKILLAGLGAVGSAAAWRLAELGHQVVAFDRFAPPHPHGSTHGDSRITRVTAWEGAEYVPLVQRAFALWPELEQHAGERLLVRTGGVFLGPPSDRLIAGSRASAIPHAVPFEELSAAAVHDRWPWLTPSAQQVGFFDPGAGMLFPERIVRAELARARILGAELHLDEPVLSWRADGEGVEVRTAKGAYRGDRLILATGAWMQHELAALGVELKVERLSLHWFAEQPARPFRPEDTPILVMADEVTHATAVFPALDGAIKVATHGGGEFVSAEKVDRTIRPAEIASARAVLDRFVPGIAGAHLRSTTCLYSNTPDGQFILDRHPVHPQVVLGSPCNGFGFKFSAASGEALARLATENHVAEYAPWSVRRLM